MKRFFAICLLLTMALSLFAGCGMLDNRMDELAGTWVCVLDDDEAVLVLESIDMYPEEIALADLDSLKCVKKVTFNEDKTYSFSYDAEATWQYVYNFYVEFFADLCTNRALLSELYGVDMAAMSDVEFYQFYADMYGAADLETMITNFTDGCYDYELLAQPYETGTFRFDGDDLLCTIDGETTAEALGFAVSGRFLTLTYADGVEEYVKED